MTAYFTSVPSGTRGVTGKAASKFAEMIGHADFNPVVFGYAATNGQSAAMQDVMMSAMIGVINSLAAQYDAGIINDATMNAKRLKDTVEVYDMA